MITNFETNKVFFAEGLQSKPFRLLEFSLIENLQGNRVASMRLPYADSPFHIWARDYMPVLVGEGKFVRFCYEPDYLVDSPEFKPDTEKILREIGVSYQDSDIILDGGNVISCGEKVILTDKIFNENPHYSRLALLARLADLLEAEPVIIPWDRYEPFGHSDGMVRFVGEGRVLLNNYCDFDPSLRRRLLDALSPHFEITELHYGSHTKYSWAYLNFLHVGRQIFVPKLGEDLDSMALGQIQEAFPECRCHAVEESKCLAKEGGALNCSTWNISC